MTHADFKEMKKFYRNMTELENINNQTTIKKLNYENN